ncbi:ScbR family autoregulator-binding transcription factor [Streptomyces sp. NPDC058221]|uniref:ScbR family autoregulator-binding transcription factor n=1 Tax=Streptomyces sp. NPDC058221 TaxID=3346388 RepID=UPI0036E60972
MRTREAVLDAAAELFARKGFPAVTIQDVAELTGMTKGAVYFHFANKEALALAVSGEFYARLEVAVRGEPSEGRSPLEGVSVIMNKVAQAFQGDTIVQAGARLQVERSFVDTALPEPYVGFIEVLVALFRAAVEAGELPAGADPDAHARVLASAFFGAQHISWVLNDRRDLDAWVHQILEVALPDAS